MNPLNAFDIAAAVQSRKASAREVTDAALRRAGEVQDKFHPFITLAPELARKQAAQVDERVSAGAKLPLAGVPFAVKDLFDVAGLPTTFGSKVLAKRIAKTDAECVKRLVDAGGVCLGKLNLHEFAFGFTGENPHYGDCRNPWDPDRVAGGSSSGSAVAVATGICPVTLGSDTGGSIRMPSALCGLVGLKPTYGRVSRAGGLPLSWTMDHAGPLTRTAAEAALVLKILAGRDPADESTTSRPVPDYPQELGARLKGVKLGLQHRWFFESLEPAVADALGAAVKKLQSLGAEIVEVDLAYLEEVVGAHRAVIFSEASAWHRQFLEQQSAEYGDSIRPLLLAGLFLPAVEYLKGLQVRRVVRRAWAEAFAKIDALVTPTTPVVATKFGQAKAALPGGDKPLVRAYLDLTLPFNLTGQPAVSVPCGFSPEGLPIGMQLVGRAYGEATVLRIAHQYQMDTEWHRRVATV